MASGKSYEAIKVVVMKSMADFNIFFIFNNKIN